MSAAALTEAEALRMLEEMYARRRSSWLPRFLYESGAVVTGEERSVRSVGPPLQANSDGQRLHVLNLLLVAGLIITRGVGEGRVFSWTASGVAFVAAHPAHPPRPPRKRGLSAEAADSGSGGCDSVIPEVPRVVAKVAANAVSAMSTIGMCMFVFIFSCSFN